MPGQPIRKRYGLAKRVVFPSILDAVRRKVKPYDKPLVQDPQNLPQGLIWGSREHALFLWFIELYMKGGINSQFAIASMGQLYTDYPEVFFPENFVDLEQYEIELVINWLEKVLREYGLGANVNEVKRHWVWNAIKLGRFWESDPRKLFVDADKNAELSWESYASAKSNYDALCDIIIRNKKLSHDELMATPYGFYGFMHKMVSMISYFMIHAGMVKPFAYPVPVDFHILRVLVSTGILFMKNMKRRPRQSREKFLPLAREVTLRYVVEMKEDPQLLADGLWLLSRTYCRHHPGNKCSIDKIRKARSRHITEIPVVWNKQAEERYDRTCAQCPVERSCKYNVPSAYYYVKGIVLVTRLRDNPEQLKLINTPSIFVQINRSKREVQSTGFTPEENGIQGFLFD